MTATELSILNQLLSKLFVESKEVDEECRSKCWDLQMNHVVQLEIAAIEKEKH